MREVARKATRPLTASNMDSGVSPFVCPISMVSGTMQSGTGLPGTGIAAVTSVIFDSCRATMGFDTTITANNLPWLFNAISYNAGTQVTTGTLTGFAVTVSHFGCTHTIGAPD